MINLLLEKLKEKKLAMDYMAQLFADILMIPLPLDSSFAKQSKHKIQSNAGEELKRIIMGREL